MKRYLIAVLILALAFPFGAYAQWYLFPGGRPASDSVAVAQKPDSTAVTVRQDSIAGTVPVQDSVSHFGFLFEEPDTTPVTRVSLILPLKSNSTPNSNFLDFYCGVLMAADALCSDEHKFRLDVYDSTVGLPSAEKLDSSEIIIGPVGLDDMEFLLPRMRGKYLISPLDPKVAPLTESYNIIQAPSGWEAQADELVRWLEEDLRGGDVVVLLQNADEAAGDLTNRIAAKLGEKEIAYSIGSTPSAWEEGVKGSCRFVIASENDEFCGAAVREIALMNLRGGHNIVYSTSRLRGAGDLEVESLHAAAARITASYYADPMNIAVRLFAENYRELFKAEPGQWAFQGYDLMNYFGNLAARNPGLWQEELAATPGQGLQTDFSFDASGKNNTAVRRLKYNANNTITVIK